MSTDPKSVFDLYDSRATGKVGLSELQLIVRTLGYRPSNAELESSIKQYLPNKSTSDSHFSFLDCQTLLTHLPKDSNEQELLNAMKVFDRDDNGLIPIGELQSIFTTLGEPIDTTEFNVLMNQLHADESGRVKYSEFIKLIAK